ncbi:hypothetical protein GcM1_207029, partial [Golovinomyces cichoracearum]
IQTSTRQPQCDQRPGHSQPHPENFSGFDPTLYPQVQSLLEAKLQINAKAIGDRLVSQNEPVGYENFASQLRKTSDKMEFLKTWNDRRNRSRGLTPQSTQTLSNEPDGDPTDWEPTQTINIANIQRNVMRQTQPD